MTFQNGFREFTMHHNCFLGIPENWKQQKNIIWYRYIYIFIWSFWALIGPETTEPHTHTAKCAVPSPAAPVSDAPPHAATAAREAPKYMLHVLLLILKFCSCCSFSCCCFSCCSSVSAPSFGTFAPATHLLLLLLLLLLSCLLVPLLLLLLLLLLLSPVSASRCSSINGPHK